MRYLRNPSALPNCLTAPCHTLRCARVRTTLALLLVSICATLPAGAASTVTGDLKQWHKVTLTIDGPQAVETDTDPNPFCDYRMSVQFRHESGAPSYTVPGYFAADGNAANTSAVKGNQWRAHLSPDKAGKWTYTVSFVRGKRAAVEDAQTEPVPGAHGLQGAFEIRPTDKTAPDFRGRGRLSYVGGHYLRFAGSGEYFLKAGPDSPENLLAYADFDGTSSAKTVGTARAGEAVTTGLKTWQPHVKDWRLGDISWKNGKGKGLVGALNYLSSKGCNSFSFLTYNAGGDGDDVWPFVARDKKFHYDCSKLDQWQMVFDHATAMGLFCHFKTQETENDDLNGPGAAQSLDGGDLGPERKLYYRELIARFGHLLALNWNLGEENTQSAEQLRDCAKFFRDHDPYRHLVVVHTYPDKQEQVYPTLLGDKSLLTGASLQNAWNAAHQKVLQWRKASAQAGRPWAVANDEQGPASLGVPPDPGFQNFAGPAKDKPSDKPYDLHDIRKATLWGVLMGGGWGVEYYFGYTLPENDLKCQDFRSREESWEYCQIALRFFAEQKIPFWEMEPADALVGNSQGDNSRYCFAKAGQVYLVYLPSGGSCELDLRAADGAYKVRWFDPRSGGSLQTGSVSTLQGGAGVKLGEPPSSVNEDWLAIVSR